MKFNVARLDKLDKSNIRDAKAKAKQEEKYWSKIDAEEQLNVDDVNSEFIIKKLNTYENFCHLNDKAYDESYAIMEEVIRTNREETKKLEDQYLLLKKQYKKYARELYDETYTIVEEAIDANRVKTAMLEGEYEMILDKFSNMTSEYKKW